mgnify:CR=1 FL=1
MKQTNFLNEIKREIHIIISVLAFFGFLALAQIFLNRYVLHILTLIAIYIILTVSLNLTNGYTGLFSLGHAGFMAVGAYASTLLTFPVALRLAYELPLLPKILGGPNYQWPFLPAVIVSGFLAVLFALAIGTPVLRLRGHYLSVATLGFMVIVETLAINLRWLTRGSIGINAIPHYTNIWWAYGWAIITIYVVWRLVNSRYGRAFMAIREDEIAAQVMGINLMRYKLMSFAVGAFFAGVAGALYAHLTTAISPYVFSFGMTFDIVIMLIVGGMGTITGSILGASLLVALRFILKPIEEGLRLYGLIEVIYAILLIVVMLKKPRGLSGGKELSLKSIAEKIMGFIW